MPITSALVSNCVVERQRLSISLDRTETASAAEIRGDFPALHQKINGFPLVYLDSAATTHRPHAVIDATSNFYQHDNANPSVSLHTLGAPFRSSLRSRPAHRGAIYPCALPRRKLFGREAPQRLSIWPPRPGAPHIFVPAMKFCSRRRNTIRIFSHGDSWLLERALTCAFSRSMPAAIFAAISSKRPFLAIQKWLHSVTSRMC